MRNGKAVLVVAGLPKPFEGVWVPLRRKKWRAELGPVLNGAGVIEVELDDRVESLAPEDGMIVIGDRARFVLMMEVAGIDRITVELLEV